MEKSTSLKTVAKIALVGSMLATPTTAKTNNEVDKSSVLPNAITTETFVPNTPLAVNEYHTHTHTHTHTPDTVEPTETPEPTQTSEPVIYKEEREHLKNIMKEYGQVDQEKLSDAYWTRIKEGIDKYGEAKRIVAFEFHGDNYSMYESTYSMTPQSFEKQMTYLTKNDYHFVTVPEIVGYIEGWLKLPARSVILTTDSGSTSMESLPRMTALADKLKSEYGYAPHYNSYIWTKDMTPEESKGCPNDKCWATFRDALKSGYFSFGTHTESHRDFASLSFEEGLADLEQSRKEIKDNMGITVNGISWPFESTPPWMNKLKEHEFFYGYGGRSRSLDQGYTYSSDNLAMALPRILPPNPSGVSGRPDGQTLEQILNRMINSYSPLKSK